MSKIIGVVMECNPFHNGHAYFLSQINKEKDDILVAIISTSITQRGEVSVLNKKTKTKLLLENGVDLVIALPSIYSNQGGDYFAFHAMRYLKEVNIDMLYFGSESNDLHLLKKYSQEIKQGEFAHGIHSGLASLKANDILGISYIRALKKLDMKNVEVRTVKRIVNNYNDTTLAGSISSATSIRKNYQLEEIKKALPSLSLENMAKVDEAKLYDIFRNNLQFATQKKIFLANNNELINRMKKISASDLNSYIELCSDKNNTKNKIRRVIINVIMFIDESYYSTDLNYIQVLGFNNKCKIILKNKKIVTSLKNQTDYTSQVELQASKLFEIVTGIEEFGDFDKPVIGE